MITVLLIDDQAQVRQGLRMRLEMEPDLVIVGEAAGAEEAVALVAQLKPRVLVMDVEMPDIDGITATAMLRDASSSCAVVILTMHGGNDALDRALAAGAVAYIEKPATGRELVQAIRRAARTPPA